MKRRRYQYGSLTKKSNRRSEDVWQYRFYETAPDGRRFRRSTSVGTVAQYPTRTDALRVIEPLRPTTESASSIWKTRLSRRTSGSLHSTRITGTTAFHTTVSFVDPEPLDSSSVGHPSSGASEAGCSRGVVAVSCLGTLDKGQSSQPVSPCL